MKSLVAVAVLGLSLTAQAGTLCHGEGTYLKDNSKKQVSVIIGGFIGAAGLEQIHVNIDSAASTVLSRPLVLAKGLKYSNPSFDLMVFKGNKSASFTFYTDTGYNLEAPQLTCTQFMSEQ